MKKLIPALMLSACLVGASAWAADEDVVGTQTTASTSEIHDNMLMDEGVGIRPHLGFISFGSLTEDSETRAAAGLMLDMNVARLFNQEGTPLYIGPSTGLFYSHIGDPSSNFFGADSSSPSGNAGANMLIVPVNAKVGVTFENMRLAAHGGGNAIYQSRVNSVNIGSDSSWKMYPNIGGDFDFGLGEAASLSLRPDWTLTSGEDIFTGTIGLGIALG